jgi:hypothetical protein
MFVITAIFFIIATLYSSVGFGGGSSYTAILAVSNTPYTLIPKISLVCNIIVVTAGLIGLFRHKNLEITFALPFLAGSVPMAYFGGVYPISKENFYLLLCFVLFIIGVRTLILSKDAISVSLKPYVSVRLIIGGILGALSGLVGIGGGVFLSPLIINLGWANSKSAAAVSCCFIFFNSVSGLLGQFSKSDGPVEFSPFYPLFIAVILGGILGSMILNSKKVSYRTIQLLTGSLTIVASLRLFYSYVIRLT